MTGLHPGKKQIYKFAQEMWLVLREQQYMCLNVLKLVLEELITLQAPLSMIPKIVRRKIQEYSAGGKYRKMSSSTNSTTARKFQLNIFTANFLIFCRVFLPSLSKLFPAKTYVYCYLQWHWQDLELSLCWSCQETRKLLYFLIFCSSFQSADISDLHQAVI